MAVRTRRGGIYYEPSTKETRLSSIVAKISKHKIQHVDNKTQNK